jgi:hypothetical protein
MRSDTLGSLLIPWHYYHQGILWNMLMTEVFFEVKLAVCGKERLWVSGCVRVYHTRARCPAKIDRSKGGEGSSITATCTSPILIENNK